MESIQFKKRDVFFLRALETDELLIIILTTTLVILLASIYLWDRNQKQHTVLRNYPIIGHFRYFLE
uniref:hypothetical protein n=1 Tax=Legionella sp. TaxID=459 RepID=UPI00321FA8C1